MEEKKEVTERLPLFFSSLFSFSIELLGICSFAGDEWSVLKVEKPSALSQFITDLEFAERPRDSSKKRRKIKSNLFKRKEKTRHSQDNYY